MLVEQWIYAKYLREEFSCHTEHQNVYTSGYLSGFLMKRGKEDRKYLTFQTEPNRFHILTMLQVSFAKIRFVRKRWHSELLRHRAQGTQSGTANIRVERDFCPGKIGRPKLVTGWFFFLDLLVLVSVLTNKNFRLLFWKMVPPGIYLLAIKRVKKLFGGIWRSGVPNFTDYRYVNDNFEFSGSNEICLFLSIFLYQK